MHLIGVKRHGFGAALKFKLVGHAAKVGDAQHKLERVRKIGPPGEDGIGGRVHLDGVLRNLAQLCGIERGLNPVFRQIAVFQHMLDVDFLHPGAIKLIFRFHVFWGARPDGRELISAQSRD